MYRPTVRYDDQYRTYVDELFQATTLDRNQIIRLALFTAAHSQEFANVISKYKKRDVTSLPQADWPRDQHRLWLEQTYTTEEGDVKHANKRRKEITSEVAHGIVDRSGAERRQGTGERREGALPSISIPVRNQGGVVFKVN